MGLYLANILDSSTVDYPGKLASVIYLCICPYSCPFCHNPELKDIKNCSLTEIDYIVDLLKDNFLIDAVCITGGEPLAQEETIELLRALKQNTDFLLKIDHNLYFPDRLELALPFLDMISTDIKAPLDERYGKLTGRSDWETVVKNVKKSLELLKTWDKPKEGRTTVVPGMNDSEDDIREVANIIKDYNYDILTLQQFRNDKTLDPKLMELTPPSLEKMRSLGRVAKEILPDRTVKIVTAESGFEEIKL